MFIAASGNQCDRTTMRGAIRVDMNARVQLRRNAHRERPEKGRGNKYRGKSTPRIVRTCQAVHRGPSLRQRSTPRKQFLGGHTSSRLFVVNFPKTMGTQRIAFTQLLPRAAIAVREAHALPGLNALHHSLLFSVAVTLR